MKRAMLIVLSFGLLGSMASAQPDSADQPSNGGGYGRGGYGGGHGGGYGESPYGMGGRMEREPRIDPRQTQKLIEGWKNSKEAAEREKLETELRALLRREFATRLAVHEREIKQLEEKVRQLRERLALRKEKQEEIVNHRLQQILREAQGLGWGSEGSGREPVFHYSGTADAAEGHSNDLLWPPAAGEPLTTAEAADDILGEPTSVDPEPAPNRN
jgi:hypothetical protein